MPAAIGIAANQSDRFSFGTRASSQVMSAQALALFQPSCGGETVVLGGDDLVRTGSVSARSEHGGDFLVSFTGLTDPGYRWQVSYCYTEIITTTFVPETCSPGYTTSETERDVAYLGSVQVIHPDAEKWIEEATENALDARDITVGNPPTTTTIDPDGSVDPSNYSPASPAPGVSSDPAVRETGAPTTGVGRLPDGTLFELQSGAGGPAMTDVGLNNPTPDINSHRSHVEGHAAAIMQQNNIQEMTISIDHAGGTCPTCQNGVPSDLGPGQTLNVISPDGNGGVRVQQITRDGGVVELSGAAYDRIIARADLPATALP